MRTITYVGIGFVLLLALGYSSYLYIDSSANTLTQRLAYVDDSIHNGKWDRAEQEFKSTQNIWQNTKKWWTLLLDHQEIDNIDISMQRLGQYVKTKGVALSLAEVSSLHMLVEHIADTESFTLTNIF